MLAALSLIKPSCSSSLDLMVSPIREFDSNWLACSQTKGENGEGGVPTAGLLVPPGDCPPRHHPPRDWGLRRPPDQASPHHNLDPHGGGSKRPRVSTDVPRHLPGPDGQETIIFADSSRTMGLTTPAGGAALELRLDKTGQLGQHHLMGITIFGASSHEELKTLAIIVNAITAVSKAPRDQLYHVWVVSDAAVDFQIVGRLAR